MKRVFTRSYIVDAAKQQHKRVEEAALILLALILLILGIAGFRTLLKSNLQIPLASNQSVTEETAKKNLLTHLFTDLKLSCSPVIDHSQQGVWNGICHSLNNNLNAKSYRLTINSTSVPKRYKGFKLANEVFYVVTKREELLAGKHTAFSFSTFILGGATFVKVSKKASPIYMFGFGLGLGFLIDKKMQIEFKEITPVLTAKG